MVYLPTFTIKINHMYVNIPYMDDMGIEIKHKAYPKQGYIKGPLGGVFPINIKYTSSWFV